MPSSRGILRILSDIDGYLSQFNKVDWSAIFERVIAETLSHILYLPFYSSDNDRGQIPRRVVWLGNTTPLCKAPDGPDAIAYCSDFNFVIEATMKTGTKQWSQEFAPSVRHCERFCADQGILPGNTYVLLICSKLHIDTYRSIRSHNEYRLIPLEISDISRVLSTCVLASTIRHLEIRGLLHSILHCVGDSASLASFRTSVDGVISQWQRSVLNMEKSVFVGLRSYEVMQRIGRQHIGVTEILEKLQRRPVVNQYFKIIDEKVGTDLIADALIGQAFAAKLAATYDDELIFQPVPAVDFKHRSLRLIQAVERA